MPIGDINVWLRWYGNGCVEQWWNVSGDGGGVDNCSLCPICHLL